MQSGYRLSAGCNGVSITNSWSVYSGIQDASSLLPFSLFSVDKSVRWRNRLDERPVFPSIEYFKCGWLLNGFDEPLPFPMGVLPNEGPFQWGSFPMRLLPNEGHSQWGSFPMRVLPIEGPSQWGSFPMRVLPNEGPSQWGSFPTRVLPNEGPSQWGSFPMRVLPNEGPSQWGSFPMKVKSTYCGNKQIGSRSPSMNTYSFECLLNSVFCRLAPHKDWCEQNQTGQPS